VQTTPIDGAAKLSPKSQITSKKISGELAEVSRKTFSTNRNED
jgi:hypothetical protein